MSLLWRGCRSSLSILTQTQCTLVTASLSPYLLKDMCGSWPSVDPTSRISSAVMDESFLKLFFSTSKERNTANKAELGHSKTSLKESSKISQTPRASGHWKPASTTHPQSLSFRCFKLSGNILTTKRESPKIISWVHLENEQKIYFKKNVAYLSIPNTSWHLAPWSHWFRPRAGYLALDCAVWKVWKRKRYRFSESMPACLFQTVFHTRQVSQVDIVLRIHCDCSVLPLSSW